MKPGQPVDVVLKLRPGETFSATVESVVPIKSDGQVQASGNVPEIGTTSGTAQRFIVIVNFDDENIDRDLLAGEAIGTAAIDTESAQMTQVIRRVMLRMQNWMNYVLP